MNRIRRSVEGWEEAERGVSVKQEGGDSPEAEMQHEGQFQE